MTTLNQTNKIPLHGGPSIAHNEWRSAVDARTRLAACVWPLGKLGGAMAALSQAQGRVTPADTSVLAAAEYKFDGIAVDEQRLDQWVTALAEQWGWEAEPTSVTYADVLKLLRTTGTILLRLPQLDAQATKDTKDAKNVHTEPQLLAVLHGGVRGVTLLRPDGQTQRVDLQIVQTALCETMIAPYLNALAPILADFDIPATRQQRVQNAVLGEMLGSTPWQIGWLLRSPPSETLWQQARQNGLPSSMWALLIGYLLQLMLTLLSWWLIGRSALSSHFTWTGLLGWGLALLTTIPFQLLTNDAQARLANLYGALFKQRLLYGVLRLQPDEVRTQGAGHFLGRVMSANALEQLSLAGGLISLISVFQLGFAAVILALGAGGWPHAALLVFWMLVTLLLGWRHFQHSRTWDEVHRRLTNDLIERMVGHRTRLAQEEHSHWHDEEDALLQEYLLRQQPADRAGSRLQTLAVRGWLVLGMGWFMAVLLTGQHTGQYSAAQLAVSLGGVLLARQAFSTIVLGVQSVISALLAWKQVAPLFQAATRPPTSKSLPDSSFLQDPSAKPTEPLLVLHNVDFHYAARNQAVLHGCRLIVQHGDRLLLEGPSGGGKSTLAALIAGLRTPSRGLLLLNGLEYRSVGENAWRRHVVSAPQFHENHIFTGTLAFNLLLGKRWPPQPADLAEAEQLCRDLDLGDLLDRMPAGLQQIVGESGWQLSHGERSRLYMARTLLQNAQLIILDESFGALDPETLQRCLQCVLERAPTLLVIAHP